MFPFYAHWKYLQAIEVRYFKHFLGYETRFQEISHRPNYFEKINLKPDVFQLPKVEVSAALKMERLSAKWESIVDFVFWGEKILWLKNIGIEGYFFELVTHDGTVLSRLPLKGKKIKGIQRLFKSCFGGLHLVCENYGITVYIDDDYIMLGKKYDRREFDDYVEPCLAKMKNHLVFTRDFYRGIIKEFRIANVHTNKNWIFNIAQDESLIESYESDQNWLAGVEQHNMGEIGMAQNAKLKAVMQTRDFLNEILYQPLHLPVFNRQDTFILFNFYEDKLQFFSEKGQLFAEKEIRFHKNKKWEKAVFFDKKTEQFYTSFDHRKGKFLARIDTSTGECAAPIFLETALIKKISIFDGVLFLLNGKTNEPDWVLHKVKL